MTPNLKKLSFRPHSLQLGLLRLEEYPRVGYERAFDVVLAVSSIGQLHTNREDYASLLKWVSELMGQQNTRRHREELRDLAGRLFEVLAVWKE